MRLRLGVTGFILLILALGFLSVSAESKSTFMLTDPCTDIEYEVYYDNKNLSVAKNSEVIGETYIHSLNACSMYNNMLYIYYCDNLNKSLFIYCFDIYNDSISYIMTISSFAIDEDAFYNANCFASDGEMVYFVSGRDTKFLCVYDKGKVSKFNLKSQIKEILLTTDNLVIVITADKTYLYNNTDVVLSSCALSPHVSYVGGGIIEDSSGKMFYADNGVIKELIPETSTQSYTEAYSDVSEFDNNFYIAYEGVTVNKIKKAFADLEFTRFTKADSAVIESGKLGTGCTFTLSTGEVITVIIKGELTGEGNINSRDLKAILNHLSRKELLEGSCLFAADLDSDSEVTTKDALLLAGLY